MQPKKATPSKKKAARKKAVTKKAKKNNGLNSDQKLFCEMHLATHPRNGTRVYMHVYGVTDEKVAAAAASRLLTNVKVQEYLAKREEELFSRRFGVTQDRIAEELSVIANARLSDFGNWDGKSFTFKRFEDIPEALLGAVKSIETETLAGVTTKIKLRFHSKEKALEILAKHKKMLVDRVEHDVSDPLAALIREISGKTVGPPAMRGES